MNVIRFENYKTEAKRRVMLLRKSSIEMQIRYVFTVIADDNTGCCKSGIVSRREVTHLMGSF